MTREKLLRLSASLSELARVRSELAVFIGCALSDIDRSRTVLAVDEALANVISHGYDGREGEITVQFREDDSAFTIVIEDGAPPFDPLSREAVDIDEKLDEGASSGLGVEIFRRLTLPRYEQNDKGGNRLILRKEKPDETKKS